MNMITSFLYRKVVKNPIPMILLVALASVMAFLIANDIKKMQAATTGYDYCLNLSYLVGNISITYFIGIFLLIIYLIYNNRQNSKWTKRLFYVLGVSSFVFFVVAGQVFDYVFHHVENNYMEKLPSLARNVFTGPVYWIIIAYFFIPRMLKNDWKTKVEHEVTK